MLGKKCSLSPLKEELRIHGVPKVTHTEFCQGRTMRWALAWSFYENVQVPSPPSKKRKLEKPRKPITFLVLASTAKELAMKAPSVGIDAGEGLPVVAAWIRKLLTDLKVRHKSLPCDADGVSLFLTALENSWIHLRRKKRDRVRQLRELPRASVDFLQTPEEKTQKSMSQDAGGEGDKSEVASGASMVTDHNHESPQEDKLDSAPVVNREDVPEHLEENNRVEEPALEESVDDKEESSISGTDTQMESVQNASTSSEWFLFKCVLTLKKEGPDFLVEMHWIEGQNRDLMNQLCTYLKNQMFRLVTI